MNISRAFLAAAAFGVLLASGGCLSRVKTSSQADVAGAALDRRELADATISHWSNLSSLAAKRMMEEYGVPDEVHADHLVWTGSSPWRRTVVSNVPTGYAETGLVELNNIEQSVDYSMTAKQAADLAAFDQHVAFNPRSGELSSRADKEEHNFLRLNLADDVIHGRQTPAQARDAYAVIVSFEASGKTSPYLLGLRFLPVPETR